MKYFSLFLPVSDADYFSDSFENSFNSHCVLDLNPLKISLQQPNPPTKGHVALHHDLQICLIIIYSCLCEESLNSIINLTHDISVNLTCLFDKVSR